MASRVCDQGRFCSCVIPTVTNTRVVGTAPRVCDQGGRPGAEPGADQGGAEPGADQGPNQGGRVGGGFDDSGRERARDGVAPAPPGTRIRRLVA